MTKARSKALVDENASIQTESAEYSVRADKAGASRLMDAGNDQVNR